MKRHFTGLTDPGLVRSANQDSYYFDPEGRFFIVADGMGGHAGGEQASRIAAESIRKYLESHWKSSEKSEELLKTAIKEANNAILVDQVENPERQDMGTTAVIVAFRQKQVWRAHVGDSRLYRLGTENLEQLTEDHTWVGKAMKAGDITAEQAKVHPWRHVLSQCLGRKDLFQIDIAPIELGDGDRLILCSDGLTEEVDDEEIKTIMLDSDTPEKAALNLVEAAKNNGGSDNVTVIVVNEAAE
ncbi:protein serine/threonine phosphatase [[Leptolyngbya] sp. PCC 7376]|uniref:Stp1/IreP family PP2C-type Ser/Thr phosphatase n=1 Tax=[Leptolyngbya] sp. PCC 7376 TaxID=111781 RepID=UPI00029F0AE1|nr:Stp1/IreP family PP2C-type Ser/Thr phosphatase [[Leptolyngbya] sp. PCC 7376]AFY38009.1 protein serine/threonine phosphatase [[Leptolyngbya] sp. PCC 7376]